MEKELLAVINGMISAGGMGLLIVAALKWLVGDYFKKAAENREMEKKAIDVRLTDLRDVAGEIRKELQTLKERVADSEKKLLTLMERLSGYSEKFVGLTEALKGFVRSANERMNVIESKADKVIVKVAEITRVSGKKSGNE
jgi:predicted  nucleic acid-binding Zn-ribbon protein